MTVVDDELSLVFAALADPTRRAILERLARGDATVNQLAEPFAMTQQAVSKHLKVLERARLISRTRTAQSRPCVLDAGRLDAAAGWIARHRQIWADRHDRLDEHLATLQGTQRAGRRHDRDRRADLPAGAPGLARAAVRLHDHARAPRPVLGADRHHDPGRQHHRRPAARRRLRDHHGQRRRRQHVHDARRLRRGAPARPAGVDRGRRRGRHAHHDHLRRPARRAHRGGHPPDQRAGRAISSAAGPGRFRDQPRPLRRLPGRPPATHRREHRHAHGHLQPTAPRSRTSRTGSGPAVILVDGAMCYRGAGPMRPLAALLQRPLHRLHLRPARPGRERRHPALRGRPRDRGPAGARRAGRRRGVRLRACRPVRALACDRGRRRPGITRLALYEPPFMAEAGDGAGQGVHRAAARAARRRAARRRGRAVHDATSACPRQVVAGMRGPAGLGRDGGDRPDAGLRRRRCSAAAACPASWRRRSRCRRWSWPAARARRRCSWRARATADGAARRPSTACSTARPTTSTRRRWPRCSTGS